MERERERERKRERERESQKSFLEEKEREKRGISLRRGVGVLFGEAGDGMSWASTR